jgi:ribosome recycling factor
VHKKAEDGKVAIRNIRHKSDRRDQGAAEGPQDHRRREQARGDHVQKLTDKYIKTSTN